MATTAASKKKRQQKIKILSLMANIPVIWAGLLIGIAVAYRYESIDVLPMFTFAAFVFYTIVLIAWRLVAINKKYRFFKTIANQLAIYEGVFLLVVYIITLIVDNKLFQYGQYL